MTDQNSTPLINQIKDAKTVVVGEKIDKVVFEAEKEVRYVPRMAPPVLQLLTGRERAIQLLVEKLELPQKCLTAPKVIALRGMGGIGKSALATAVVHHPEVEQALPDGTLWVSLGSEPDLMSLLDEWGEQFGEDLNEYVSPEARSRALSSILHDKHALLVIDDVWRADDARLFNVGGEQCRVILTTRNGEVARAIAGQDVYQVETLTIETSLELLSKIAPQAVNSDKKGVRQLVTLLGGLPLGLIISGRLLSEHTDAGLSIQSFLTELQEKEIRLEMSSESQSLKTILKMSYEWRMEESHKRAFRMLGIFGGKPNTFSLDAAAEICELELQVMRKVMINLVNRALVDVVGEGRYELHALVADFASTLISLSEMEQARLNHARCFLKTALKYKAENMKEWRKYDIDWNNIRQAMNWFSMQVNLAEADESLLELMADFTVALDMVVQTRKPAEGLKWLQAGERACSILGRLEDKGQLLLVIGLFELDYGYINSAIEHFNQCEKIFDKLGDTQGLLYARGNLGIVHHKRGEYKQAIEIYERVTEMCESSGDVYGTAVGYFNQADVYYRTGEISKARLQLKKCLALCRQENDIQEILVMALALNSKISIEEGEIEGAFACCEEAFSIAKQTASKILLGVVKNALGKVWEARGVFENANQHFQESISLLTEAKAQEELAEAHVSFGEFLANSGANQDAKTHFMDAMNIFELIGAESRVKKVEDDIRNLR